MNVVTDEWSGLFSELEARINDDGRQSLLTAAIEDVKVVCLSNFGEFSDGMMRPWHEEALLSESYMATLRRATGRTVATLERSEDEREACEGTRWKGGQGAHLKDSFFTFGGSDSCTLINISEYASNQQDGEGVPARPFFPVSSNGQLEEFMEKRIFSILDSHFEI